MEVNNTGSLWVNAWRQGVSENVPRKQKNAAAMRKASLERSLEEAQGRRQETKSDIVVKPDGSRVLMVTMNMGGMETTMSMEISKPTDMMNDCRNENYSDDAQQNINADFSHHFNNNIT